MHKEARVIASRIAAFAFALCACMALAQDHAKAALTVVVKDQSGAIIPGAHVVATNQATGLRFESTADTSFDSIGQAVLHLDQGTYELTVTAKGFEQYQEKETAVTAETHRDVTLRVGSCGPCVVVQDGPVIPLERMQVEVDIPLIPMQQLVLPAKRLRLKRSSSPRNYT